MDFCRSLKVIYRGVARSILFIIGFYWIKINGKLADKREAPIIVIAPHSSFQDMLMMDSLRPLSGLSRIENRGAPILGRESKLIYYYLTILILETCLVTYYEVNISSSLMARIKIGKARYVI